MNFQFNKIAGAVLGTALGVMAVGIVAEAIYAPHIPEQPGYVIAVAEPTEGGSEEPAAPTVAPIADRLQTASAENGADDVAKCKTCHSFEKGGPNKVGPNLWDVVGHNVIHGNFDYSDAMRAKGEEGLEWTFDNLDQFITSPKAFIPGTAMSFAGVKNPEERADIIAYLRTLSDSPVPLPEPTPAAETPPAAGENPPAATESPTTETPAAPTAETPAPPAAETPAPAPEPAPAPPTEEPAAPPAPEPTAPAAETPAPAPEAPAPAPEAPAPAPEQTVPAPAPETPAPAPEPPAPAQDQPASSGASDGAQPAPAPAPAPDAEADTPDGAPAPEAPAQ